MSWTTDKKLLEYNGWEVWCESPFEIYHKETDSKATGYAAKLVLDSLKPESNVEGIRIAELAETFINEYNEENDTNFDVDSPLVFGKLGIMSPRELLAKFYYMFKRGEYLR
jgi:hypothetical protein